MKWMIKDKPLEDYLQACRDADLATVETDAVLMRMFNTKASYKAHMENIVSHFGPLDGMFICEIGGGYGGLAKAIFDTYAPRVYDIIDLPEPGALAKRYEPRVNVYTKPTRHQYDLVISNYALSEIIDNKLYIDKVLRRSKHGYITCNTDMVKLDWEHKQTPDIKGERKSNFILIW